ncbi:MAG: MaoC family dehydratase [Lachnospiraceae bacterium]|nr:MaoC family dehydratase [Candidatus Colinaster scatohippi]
MNTYSYEELQKGQIEKFEVKVTAEMLDKFRDITGDINPMHTDAEYAKAKGYNDRICYGMLTSSFLSTLAGMYLPGEKSLIHSVETIFKNPVYVGDSLTVLGEIVEKNDNFNVLDVKVQILNQDGKKVVRGKMQIGVI